MSSDIFSLPVSEILKNLRLITIDKDFVNNYHCKKNVNEISIFKLISSHDVIKINQLRKLIINVRFKKTINIESSFYLNSFGNNNLKIQNLDFETLTNIKDIFIETFFNYPNYLSVKGILAYSDTGVYYFELLKKLLIEKRKLFLYSYVDELEIKSFLIIEKKDEDNIDIIFGGTPSKFRRFGFYSELIKSLAFVNNYLGQNKINFYITTQDSNKKVQSIWSKFSFEKLEYIHYFEHK